MSSHVLAVGEALVDEVHRPDGSAAEHPGGSIANVALTLGRLGRDVRLATWLGRDERGDAVRAWLAESDVALADGSDAAERTSVAVATLDDGGSATYEFDLTWRVPEETAAGPETLAVHTGSIAAVLEPGGSQVRALVEAARATATITYDPNARPVIMGSADAARERIETLVALSDVVKVSDEDLGWLYPGQDPVEAARAWRAGAAGGAARAPGQEGPALVVVTRGGDGAVALTAGGEVEVKAPAARVVDTVGAGDSFMGALIDGLWGHDLLGAARRDALRAIGPDTLSAILEQCVAVAAITVSRAGANPPRRAELEA
ncbi:carbohydrate kinase family protein [Myceligenerans pegani]|uniref:Carbohydrate kinase n=1 Tax=Myceligenerans pegani TaxID=2776917 RepID=A0ABR9MXN4_9MICO|nr:carbohydrate kinase [Myceligenerans sp. TRM 65318]MBE1876138.1 carbohydrate kinase [Myceligenerans sp. TRM 65318]MBE3018409.1 carbohydrate kinase [Myceligenerans sp. TRM 65318]